MAGNELKMHATRVLTIIHVRERVLLANTSKLAFSYYREYESLVTNQSPNFHIRDY